MYELRIKDHFDAAHYIKDYQGKCSREHGHRWEVEVVLKGEKLDSINMLIDFSKIKEQLKATLDEFLDHYQLNESLKEPNVTAEFLSKWLYKDLTRYNKDVKGYESRKGISIIEVTVWESPDCSVTYKE